MSSDCVSAVTGPTWIADAVRAKLPTASGVHSQYPEPGEIQVVLAVPAPSPYDNTPYAGATATLTATLHDRFGDLHLALADASMSGSGANQRLADAHAVSALQRNSHQLADTVVRAVDTATSGWMSCQVQAKQEVNELSLDLAGKSFGQFSGTQFQFACLRDTRITVRYKVAGIAKQTELSPEACKQAVQLPMPSRAELDATSKAPIVIVNNESNQTGGSDGIMSQQQWFASISGAAFLLILVIVFARVLTSSKPLNPDAVKFFRRVTCLIGAAFGAALPGFLDVDLSAGGLGVRAGSAMGIFVLTYFFDPPVAAEKLRSKSS